MLSYRQTLEVIEQRPECGPKGNRVRDVVFAMLAEAKRRGREFVMPSVRSLQRLCGCDRRTVQRTFRRLCPHKDGHGNEIAETGFIRRKPRWRFIGDRAMQLASSIAYVAQLVDGGKRAAVSSLSGKKSMETTSAAPLGGPPVVSDARSAMFADLETIRSRPNARFWERNLSQWREEHPELRAWIVAGRRTK